jgi:4-amino-4-deoxy-L-arabinose transferase-like glycosyltransferase
LTLFSADSQTAELDSAGSRPRLRDRLVSIWPLLAAGLLLRLVIAYLIVPGQGLSIDLKNFDDWALTLADYGPGGFYQHAQFAGYPPGYLYFLWPIGIIGRMLAPTFGATEYDTVFAVLKLPAILADIAIGYLLYRAGRRWFGLRAGLVAAALYLFVPATWYESAVWGQVDSVGMLFLLGGLLLLIEGWSEWSVALLMFAIVIKPQFAVGLLVAAPVLLRRHLFVRGSGPVPLAHGWNARLDGWLGGLFTRRQGFVRLLSCAVVGALAIVLALLPFDIWINAPESLAGIPVVSHVAGFVGLLSARAGDYPVLTANAFNAWALVGPFPLFSELSRTFVWAYDSLTVIGPLNAATLGAALMAVVGGLVVMVLLLRDGRATILASATVLAFAVFALPTRVHERYQFPVFVTFALLIAGGSLSERRWRWWYLLVGLLAAVNLHAVVTLNQPTFASPGLIGAPLGDLFRSDAAVIVVSVANTLLFAALLAVWLRSMAWPILKTAVLRPSGRERAVRVATSPAPISTFAPEESPALAPPPVPEPAPPPVPEPMSEPPAPREPIRWAGPLGGVLAAVLQPFRARLNSGDPPPDGTAALATEGGGRLDRRDLLIMAVILVATFGVRAYRIDQPRHMYFDELYYASTATEFLQDWRYGLKTDIFEYTHPHLSKYVQAVSLATFGNDRVTSEGSVGAKVRSVDFDPAFSDPSAPGGYGGDRIAVATGDGVRIAPHGKWQSAIVVPLPGAAVVAFDHSAHRLYVTTDDGTLWVIDGLAMASAEGGGGAPQPLRLGQIGASASRVIVLGDGHLVAVTGNGQLALVDGTNARTLATSSQPGLSGLVGIVVAGQPQVVATVPSGLVRLDATNLQQIQQVGLAAAPTDLALVEGSDFGWRNQDMLPIPTLYVALESKQLEAVQLAADGTMSAFQAIAMPGVVTQVRWDRPTNMVHVLGLTASGQPTIYVVQPNVNSVFADAPLPFQPVAWMLDAQPNTPSLDRQQALAFSDSGTIAHVDTGSHAWAWRLSGLIAGVLTAVLMYLLARLLFRRRSVAVFLAIIMALDTVFFIQGRIAMNDSLLGFFIVAAFTLLVALFRVPRQGRRRWLLPLLGLPVVGLLLGLALSTKWVGAYAIGAAILIVLARTQPGRWIALGGLLLITGIFGFQALAGQPPNFAFWLLMVAVTCGVGVIMVGLRARDATSGSGADDPAWVNPRRLFGIPFALAIGCLLVIPIVVYVVSYIPWTLAVNGDPQLFPGWPPGHTGQTFLDLQSVMYHYHNDLRIPHAAGSPWWAWPFALKPVWGYYDGFSDGTQALMLIIANPFLVWLGVPAVAFGGWQAWRRRSMGLTIVLIAMLSIWLSWARIDRVAFNYHWYTILPYFYVLLAYFLAELWDGPSRRTWTLARLSFAVVLILPALMWISKDALCAVAGVALVNPGSFECSRSIADIALPIFAWLLAGLVAGWFIIGLRKPRRLVVLVLAVAAIAFVGLYPAISALPIPAGWPLIYQGLLPTWDISFQFSFNTLAATIVPLLGLGSLLMTIAAAGMVWWMMRAMARRGPGGEELMIPPSRLASVIQPQLSSARWAPDADYLAENEGASAAVAPPAPIAAPRVQLDAVRVDRWVIPLGLFVVAAVAYAIVNHGRPATLDYFVPLADALVHGQLGLSAAFSSLSDVVLGPNGLYNVVFPPAPAVLLVPPVLVFGTGFPQAWASILLGAANVAIMSLILARMGVSRQMRVALSLVFAFGTSVWFSAQVGTGWHVAHVSSLFFILLAIWACQRDARTWVIGLLFAGAVLSRLSMLAAAPFFLAYVADRTLRAPLDDRTPFGVIGLAASRRALDLRRYISLAWPMASALVFPLALYLVYNALRFGSPFENGYALIPGLSSVPAFQNGIVSLTAIPRNLFALLLASPSTAPGFPFLLPSLVGSMSLILTTPLLLWAGLARDRDWFTIGAWGSVALILVPTLLRADPGGVQFGFRYAQDLLPFLFLLAVRGLRGRISPLAWVAIGIGFAVNLWGMAYAFSGWWA